MMALALTRMTGGEVPDTVARMIDGSKLHIPSQVKVLCPPHGHANPPGMKFCGECAAPMRDAAPAVEALRRPRMRPAGIWRTCTRRSCGRCAGRRASMTPGRARRCSPGSRRPERVAA